MFAQSPYVRRVAEYAIDQSRDLNIMRQQPGYILGSLAHAHPFLDGNGRTILVLHTELAHRAGISVDWTQTEKKAYLIALTTELRSKGGESVAEVYYQEVGRSQIGQGSAAYGMALATLMISVGLGGSMILKKKE